MEDIWTDRLSDYLDDELTAADRTALEAHLRECADCRATLADLRRVVATAASLAPRPPATDLWPGIEPQLTAVSATPVVPLQPRRARRVSFTLPQLVAASLALMVLSGSAVFISQHGGRATSLPQVGAADPVSLIEPASLIDPHYDEAVTDLEQTLESGRSQLDPGTIKVLEDSLRAIDRAIDDSRRALANDPSNIYLNNHLAEAKQRKLMLLRRATALASTKG